MVSVANFDVSFLANLMVSFTKELLVSQSAGQAQYVIHDRTRSLAYIEYIKKYIEFLGATTDPLDLPQTHPGSYQVKDFPINDVIEIVENDLLKAVIWRLQGGYTELTNSQSKDRASGLVSYDKQRLLSLCDNATDLVNTGETTLDLPEYPGSPTVKESK